MTTLVFLEAIAADVRYGLRMLRRSPMFTVVALLTLAIGIGANTAVFSVVNSVVLKPLAYPSPEQLVAIWHKAPGAAGLASVSGDLRLSRSMFVTYAENNRVFQHTGLWASYTATVTGHGEPEQVRAVFVTNGAMQALDIPPLLGRWLSAADESESSAPTVMLSYGYWQRRFGGDRAILARSITVDATPRQVAGVMPRGFRFINTDTDLIVPLTFDRSKLILPGFGFQCVARLKAGVSIAEADADIARLVPVWMNSWPAAPGINPHVYESWRITPAIRPLKQDVVGNAGNVLWVLMATIGTVMLIACANVANLLLVRADARRQELAVRAALGAARGRIVRELLVESLLLAILGGFLGLVLARAGVDWLVAAAPGNLPRLDEISIDASAFAFTCVISLASGILFGLIPALKYAGPQISIALRAGGRTMSGSRDRAHTRNILVIAQVALALVLLISSGLMIRTLLALHGIQPGFRHADQIQMVRTSIPDSLVRQPERVARLENDIVTQIRAIPSVKSVGFASQLPMEGIPPDWDIVITEDKPFNASEMPPLRLFQRISPGLFQTIGTKLIAGRDYDWTDLYERRPVAILSENLARELWGSAHGAIGKRISTALPQAPWKEVIGVVEDVRQNGVQEPAPAIVYWPAYGQNLYSAKQVEVEREITIAVRSERAGTQGLVKRLHEAVWSVNASLPLASVRTMREVYDAAMARTSFTLVMLTIASAMALLLGLVGIYGVIAYVVSQRRREIGIRLALGAQQHQLRSMFLGYGLRLAAVGVSLGLAAAAVLMRLMKSVLFGVSPLDPLTYVAIPLVVAVAAMLASYLPARHAAGVNPLDALRAE